MGGVPAVIGTDRSSASAATDDSMPGTLPLDTGVPSGRTTVTRPSAVPSAAATSGSTRSLPGTPPDTCESPPGRTTASTPEFVVANEP